MKNGLYIDCRETEIIKHLEKKEITFKKEQLEIGDIIFYKNDKILLLIERKTIEDLASSIKDGRFRKQYLNIINNIDSNRCCYLIEGNILVNRQSIGNVKKKIIYGAIFNKMFRDDIKIIHSYHIEETIIIIEELVDRLIKRSLYYNKDNENNENNENNRNQINIPNICKKKNLTPNECFRYQICQIPSISTKKAEIICSKCKNMVELIEILKNNPKNLETFEFNGKKIGKNSTQKIAQYLGIN